jgi:polyisoprenoid-binding protein YceI
MKYIIAAVSFLLFINSEIAQELKINSAKSLIEFNHVEEQTIGTIKGVSGKINFDVTNLTNSFFEARVNISSIKTSNATRDKHLNAPNYFHSEKYPEIIFKSDSLYSLDNKFRLKGKLTIKEITQSEEIQFSYNDGVFNGTCIIYSNDYKIHKRKTREDSKILIKITVPIL